MVPLDECSGRIGALDQLDYIIQHGALLFKIFHLPEGMPQGPGHEHRPGRSERKRNFFHDAHRDGASPSRSTAFSNQPDRAIAKPSGGREQRNLRPRLAQPPRGRRRRLLHEPLHEFLVDVAHEAHMNRRHPAYPPLGGHLPDPLMGEDDVQIRIRPRWS